MINILSYVGMNVQSEVCLWCLLGLVRTIFDATLFKVNANLKQVWQMRMPEELSKPVQRALRTMVSGIMLVQCFTVYIYLAAYIVLLYPVFLEERPALVLPWLLLAAVRKLLCELTSLALGLGTCLLLGPARQPCIKFVIVKFASIIPAFYMWMLVFSYYHTLKVAAAFKTFPANLPHSDNDYGLELAVRRRRTKSLLGEDQLRKKLVASLNGESTPSTTDETHLRPVLKTSPDVVNSTDTNIIEEVPESDVMKPPAIGWSDIGAYVYEDWFGNDILIPRDTDRILEQFVLMLLRIGTYLKRGDIESVDSQIFNTAMSSSWHPPDNIDCTTINADATETPPHIGSSKGNIASYLREYPQIFMKKQGNLSQTELTFATLKTAHSLVETDESTRNKNKENQNSPNSRSHEEISSGGFEKVASKKKITISDSITIEEDKSVKLTLPPELQIKRTSKAEEVKLKSKLKTKRGTDDEKEKYPSEIVYKVLDLQESKTPEGDFNQTSSESKQKRTRIAILNDGNNKTENKTPKQKHNDEFTLGETEIEESLIQSKQLNTADVGKKISSTTVLQEFKQESELSQFLTAQKNDGRINNPDVSIPKENNNEEFNYNEKVSKAVTSGKISKDGSNLTKNKEDKNKELPLRILSNDDNIRGSLEAKITKNDSKIKIKRSETLNEHENEHMRKEISNKELPLRILSNDNNNYLDNSQIKCLRCNNKCTDKELPLRIQSNEDTTINSLNVKESSKDETAGSTDDKTPKEMGCKITGCNCQKIKTAKNEKNLHREDHTKL